MISKRDLIEKAYKMPYNEIEPYLNSEYWVFVSSIQKDFPDYEISKEDNYFDNSHGYRFQPKMLSGIEDNGGWELSGYHDSSTKKNPFRDGEYYRIGFLNHDGTFAKQGVREYKEGFFDDDNYHLKPFPTHYIRIERVPDPIYS